MAIFMAICKLGSLLGNNDVMAAILGDPLVPGRESLKLSEWAWLWARDPCSQRETLRSVITWVCCASWNRQLRSDHDHRGEYVINYACS